MSSAKRTIIVQQYKESAKRPTELANSYSGLRIHALPGLHEVLGSICSEQFTPGASVLDLAAGSGAMSRRLKNLGFVPTAVDYVSENFQAPEIPFKQKDLNEDFADSFDRSSFGGIIASEIIEHLENPWHFFRQCERLLGVGGKIVLSTPNTQNSASIASLVRNGQFLWFSDKDREIQGHISPLTLWQMRYAIKDAGLRIDWEGSYGQNHSKLRGSPRMAALARLIDVIASTPNGLRGEIYLCVACKAAT